MSDRELLELAAKATGFYFDPSITDPDGDLWGCFSTDSEQLCYPWNPRDDDGDALRLAVDLGIDIRPSMAGPTKFRYATCQGGTYTSVNPDPRAATRRAILMCAADIGSRM